MKKIILHVGSGKAGSTSIQQALLHSRKNNINFVYPVIPGSPGNQVIRYAFSKANTLPKKIRDKYRDEDGINILNYQESIKSSLADQCNYSDTVIISSEFLFGANKEEVIDVGKFLRDMGFLYIHLIMYLRDPSKYYVSSAQQALKKHFRIPVPGGFKYPMLDAVGQWLNLMPTTVTVREFDVMRFIDGDVVKDFDQYLSSLGIDAELKLDHPLNESMSSEVAQAVQDCQRYLSKEINNDQLRLVYRKRIRKLIRYGVEGGTKPKLRKGIENYIYNRYSVQLKELHSRFGLFDRVLSNTVFQDGLVESDEYDCITSFKDIVDEFDNDLYEKIKVEMLGMG
ncbi:hypothetical protein FJZ33_02335 [Candidatus Poribacteria bacterium]|nr:hypothetical protein [Candidatus Poribacteria bacterium]